MCRSCVRACRSICVRACVCDACVCVCGEGGARVRVCVCVCVCVGVGGCVRACVRAIFINSPAIQHSNDPVLLTTQAV